jgi:hypothetical protein
VKKGITVVYWGETLLEPIIVAGKLVYLFDDKDRIIKDFDHWDLYSAWFDEPPDDKKVDGETTYVVNPRGKNLQYLKEACLFGLPLVNVKSELDVKTKISDKLLAI